MKNVYKIPIPVFETDVYFIIGFPNGDTLAKYLIKEIQVQKKLYKSFTEEVVELMKHHKETKTQGVTWRYSDSSKYVLCQVAIKPKNIYDINVLALECYHVVDYFKLRQNLHIVEESNESEALLYEYIFMQCLHKLFPLKKLKGD